MMLLTTLLALTLPGDVIHLECRVGPNGPAGEVIGVSLSIPPGPEAAPVHVETRGDLFRTSTTAVGRDGRGWWWEDVRDEVDGVSMIDPETLAYRSERGGRTAAGACRRLTTALWFGGVPFGDPGDA